MDATRHSTKGFSMSRSHFLAAAAALLLAVGTRADEPKADAAPADPRVEAIVKQAVEKAKQELRDELRAEVQGAQAAAEFMGTVSEGPKLQFFELDGSLRLRGDLFDNFGFRRARDANGQFLFPRPGDASNRGTQTSSNMRLRLEPTLNVSEHVRVRSGVDVLDGYVLGTSGGATWAGASPADRSALNVRRVWGEVETPVGLISFGRMPAAFGLGLVSASFDGLDDDWGDSKDRLQFATLPVSTPAGPLNLVPYLDFDAEGPLQNDLRQGAGAGQPFNLDSKYDGRTWGLKLVRLDTDDELRRKLEHGASSMNYGAVYTYSTLGRVLNPNYGTDATTNVRTAIKEITRREYRHQVDLWFRYRTPRLLVEAEATGMLGRVGDPGPLSATLDYAGPTLIMRQAGGALRATYQAMPGKLTVGGEFGIASGDRAPGFGNAPRQLGPTGGQPVYGSLEGPQYGFNCDPAGLASGACDRTVSNFRFNPGYRVDLILWREILGQVTDAWYLKPTLRWDILSGLSYEGQIVYSQAIFGASTPSAGSASSGHRPLGVELDNKFGYVTDDGFAAWLQYGVLFPLDGFRGGGSLTRAHALRAGLAVKF
jgi:uncharacterized protein (TIGR04551 family)